jgi:hypothetical protein
MLNSEKEVKDFFQRKFPYIDKKDVDIIFCRAQNAYLDLAFPFNVKRVCIPCTHSRAWSWVFDCMVEITEREGASGAVSYSENGLSMSWDSSQISQGLIKRIVPEVGVF